MNKKKKIILICTVAILLIALVVTIIIIVTKNNSKSLKYSDKKTDYKVKINFTEDINKDNYELNKDNVHDFKNALADFSIKSDKVNIEFEEKYYTFQKTMEYIDKYGEKEGNFENFKKYVQDKDIMGEVYSNIETFNVNGIDGIQYIYDNTLIRVLNTKNIEENKYVAIRVYPKNEEDNISDLMQDEELKKVLDAIELNKK